MKKIMYIQASPMEELSYSTAVANAFVEAYKKAHSEDRIETLNLFKTQLPPFDGDVIRAKYAIMHGKPHTDEQKRAWAQVEKIIAEFKSADKYVFSVPMWNFGIPYKLKHFIDVVTQPGYTFSYSPQDGYKGLVTGKPVMVVYARGGEYQEGAPSGEHDLQKKYFDHALRFIGFTDIRSILVERTLYGPEAAASSRDAAVEEARKAAGQF
jgi:FMN-dependent NADH-azoreductase